MELNDPPTVVADERWRSDAACATVPDPGPFYDRRHPNPLRDRCPVSEPCLWAALALEDRYGYRFGWWGGVSAERRARIAASLPGNQLGVWYRQMAAGWSPTATPAPLVEAS